MRKLTVEPDSVLAAIKQRLLDAFGDNVQQIVLFGSRARGDAAQDSDYDILVLLKDCATVPKDLVYDVAYDILDRYGVVATLFLEEGATFEHDTVEPLFCNIRREGAVL